MKRDAMIFYKSFYEAIAELDAETFKATVLGILEYGLNGKEVKVDGIAKVILSMAKPQIDANNKRFANGAKGGRPKKTNGLENDKPMVIEEKTNTYKNKNHRLSNKKPNVNVNVKDNVKDNVNVNVKDKKPYGSKLNVMLTDREYEKLHKDFSNADEMIEFLSKYMVEKEYNSKSHNLSLRRWVYDAVTKHKSKSIEAATYIHAQQTGALPASKKATKETLEKVKELQRSN